MFHLSIRCCSESAICHSKFYSWAVLVSLMVMSSSSRGAMTWDETMVPNDVLLINVFDHPELSIEVRVSEGGEIEIPLIGSIYVEGMTLKEVESSIVLALVSGDVIDKPVVAVDMNKYQSETVAVLGGVLIGLAYMPWRALRARFRSWRRHTRHRNISQ